MKNATQAVPLWAEQAFTGATKMADTFAALHILQALTAKWPVLAALPEAYQWQQTHKKPVVAFTGGK